MLGVGAGVTFGIVGLGLGFSSGSVVFGIVEFGSVLEPASGLIVPGVTSGLVVLGVTFGLVVFGATVGKFESGAVEFGIVVFGAVGAVTSGGVGLVLLFGVITPGC